MESTTKPASEQVVETVATSRNTEPTDLPLLYEILDPEALDTIVRTMTDGKICFEYAGHAVTVQSDGTVNISDASPHWGSHPDPAISD